MDWRSARGKASAGVELRCRRAGVPCIALCGSAGQGAEDLYACGISAIFSAVNRAAECLPAGRRTCRMLFAQVISAILRLPPADRQWSPYGFIHKGP
ncbi:MAG: glycerate kinase [Oscillibacter sp.]|nr:glycerate kinase [Oscillibacter sp.]